jgi:hypothetical protein
MIVRENKQWLRIVPSTSSFNKAAERPGLRLLSGMKNEAVRPAPV